MHIKPTPKKPIPSGRRTITEVPDNELKEAVMDMVNRLHIPGQGNGYDLYTAILEEKKKASGAAAKILTVNRTCRG